MDPDVEPNKLQFKSPLKSNRLDHRFFKPRSTFFVNFVKFIFQNSWILVRILTLIATYWTTVYFVIKFISNFVNNFGFDSNPETLNLDRDILPHQNAIDLATCQLSEKMSSFFVLNFSIFRRHTVVATGCLRFLTLLVCTYCIKSCFYVVNR